MTIFDFGSSPVPAHRHLNPGGSEGGWVADTAYVAPTAYVGPDAQVYGSAWVFDLAVVYGSALVSGSAIIDGVRPYLHWEKNELTPECKSGDFWTNSDDCHTIRLGCWRGTVDDLEALIESDKWPSGGDAEYRATYAPNLRAVVEQVKQALEGWKV